MMKKFWETETCGPHIYIICRVEFAEGRIGGASRCVHHRQWEELHVAAKHEYFKRSVQIMDQDIEQIAQKHGAK